mmetsp:Transcript_36562/g.82625  ORF Transcript_36562/g.82625 Transcript_36562/m.82625 type:complete len:91 (-) Transcript_36562:414-686(-)
MPSSCSVMKKKLRKLCACLMANRLQQAGRCVQNGLRITTSVHTRRAASWERDWVQAKIRPWANDSSLLPCMERNSLQQWNDIGQRQVSWI